MDAQTLNWRRLRNRWLGASLILHLIAALCSYGYYDVDEHFQILEFLNARLGRSPFADLPWEYAKHMRPWTQPLFYELPTRLWIALGVQDPFTWATSARVLSALIGWLSLCALAACLPRWFKAQRWRDWALKLSCLFWFTPYLHARTSSENLSGSFFLLGLAVFVTAESLPGALAAGALLGLSFDCRYQIAAALAGFGLWLLLERVSARRISGLAAGFLATAALGLALDAWIYGAWTWTPWNYFDQNIVQGAAAAVGRSPWSNYLTTAIEQVPPLGAVLVLGTLAGWCARPRHVLSVTSFTFVLAHTWIGHKELRFLFPIASMLPALAVLALERWETTRIPRPIVALATVFLAIDLLVLMAACLKPSTAQIGFYKAVYRHEPPIRRLYRPRLDPYAPFGVPMHFYRPAGLEEPTYGSEAELLEKISGEGGSWVFSEDMQWSDPKLASQCTLEYTAFPAILNSLTFLPGPRRFANRWSLFWCTRPSPASSGPSV